MSLTFKLYTRNLKEKLHKMVNSTKIIISIAVSVRQVAFSVALFAEGDGNIGPFHKYTNLVFRYVATNIGLAYNTKTGI